MQSVDRLHDGCFRIIIQCGSGLIQDQYLRIIIQRSGDTDTLSLSSGEADTPLADASLQTFRQSLDKFIQLCLFQYFPQSVLINLVLRHTEGYIFTDGVIQHEDHLGDVADILQPFPVIARFLYIHAVCIDMSRTGLQQSQQNIHHGTLARAGSTHDTYRCTHRDLQIRMVEDQTLRIGIGISNIFHLDAFFYIQLFIFIGSKGHVDILSVDLIL